MHINAMCFLLNLTMFLKNTIKNWTNLIKSAIIILISDKDFALFLFLLIERCEIMKAISFVYSSDHHFEELIKANGLSRDKNYLVRIHTCTHNSTTIVPFINKILYYLPNSHIIGSSTSGVIINGKILTDCCAVSITDFLDATVSTHMISLNGNDGADITGKEIADRIISEAVSPSSVFMLAFFARPYLKTDEFVEKINVDAPQLQMLGGFANTPDVRLINMTQHQSFVFNEKQVSGDCAVFAVIDSKIMSVYSDIIYVTEPMGKVYTVTDADGMIIRSVDGENAVDWYQNLLGINLNKYNSDDNPAIATVTFPIVKSNHNDTPWAIAYSPQTKDNSIFNDEPDPVMYVPSEVEIGDKIRIAYSSIQKTIEVCENVCEHICSHPSEVLFGYSCVSRQEMFSNCSKWELLPFEKTNLCGALVAGEFGNIRQSNTYCNYSFAIASLSERHSMVKLDINALHDHSSDLVNTQEDIVDYLLRNNKNPIRKQQQQEIKSSLFIDDETGLGNITKYRFDYKVGKFNKICMITIRNEGLLKAFLSESKFLIYFNRFHKCIMDFLGSDNYRCYVYKKNSLIITGAPAVSEETFSDTMHKLQVYMTDFIFSSYPAVSEFSLVLEETDLIKKAELTLVRMRTRKHLFMTYTPELGLEGYNAHKMNMIKILNDAISNNRIVPYFQGIHDNSQGEIAMYESLMRIEDSEGNVYTPYHFMDIAKEYGYYADLSYIMINKVLELFRNRNEKVTINMNISDVHNYKIIHSILKFLRSAPHPENFVFELTETEEIVEYPVIFEFVEKVHEAGGSIAIDDFGSGFSNIVNVFKIKSDYIKIDGEIIRNIQSDVYALEFLEMISQWAKKHSKEIIAEFVENTGIQEILDKNQIRFSQGYLYSQPHKRFGA